MEEGELGTELSFLPKNRAGSGEVDTAGTFHVDLSFFVFLLSVNLCLICLCFTRENSPVVLIAVMYSPIPMLVKTTGNSSAKIDRHCKPFVTQYSEAKFPQRPWGLVEWGKNRKPAENVHN